jgi:enoyl-CoA hydratase/carnithine racemase
MAWTTILAQRDGTLGRITLNRPQQRNPLDRTTATEIGEALDLHLADDAVRSIVITGAGDAFCAGGDIAQMREFNDLSSEAALDWPVPIAAIHHRLINAAKPVIAAVNGPAVAGGLGLAAMCDVILAVRSATFAVPEVRIGLFPLIVLVPLSQAIPRKALTEMIFTGDPIDAEEAHRLGLVSRVVDDAEALEAAVQAYAKRFATVSPAAVRMGRRAFTIMDAMPHQIALDATPFLNVPIFLGEEMREGATAFLEKRRPGWAAEHVGSDPLSP